MSTKQARKYFKGKGGPLLLPKLPNQAEPFNASAVTRPGSYRTGDGDFPTTRRPGSDDFLKCPSYTSSGMAVYHRGHV